MHRRFAPLAATAACALALPLAISVPAGAAVPTDTTALQDAVTVEGVMEHLQAFQAIADANRGTRASGTPGYDASATYVADRLEAAGYDVTTQPFTFPFFQELAPTVFERTDGIPVAPGDYTIMEYSGSGDVTAPLQAVDLVLPPPTSPGSTSGCEPEDFAGFTDGNIALIQRGTCTFEQKALNAAAAGAAGVVIFNEGQAGRTETLSGTLGNPSITIPVIGASFALGEQLATDLPVVRIFTQTLSETRETLNVLAQTPTGRTDRVVVVGAHLDSVPEGPGINDNGSGSATILEIAEQLAGHETENAVRFAFWGAEESGLLGAEHYVSQLSKREIKDIALNLNFDMLGSANFVRFVYDGDGNATGTAGPNGSATIERVFLDHFAAAGLPTEPTAFDGRSDYGPFIAVGIPAGGLFSGAEVVKTAEQAATYGGVAGAAFDPCYHQACDSFSPVADGADATLYSALANAYGNELVGNINTRSLGQLGDGAAHAVLTFAQTTSAVNGTGQASSTAAAVQAEHDGHRLGR